MSFNINKTPFFTVIVPVYNTNESYLIAAIESVINQTFKDYELIIVDDASTVDYKIKNYNNIKYIRNETNKGTLYSRKIGTINSNGKYIIYLDADDRLTTDALQIIYNSINKDYDIIHFGTKIISDFDSKDIKWNLSTNRFNINSEFLLNEVIDKKISHNMCAKAFNINIIKKLIEYISDIQIKRSKN